MNKAWQLRPSVRDIPVVVLWSIGLTIALPLDSALWSIPVGVLLLAVAFEPQPRRVREATALAAPLWLFWALHYRAVGSWWLGDDPCHLVQSLDHGLWGPYVEPVGYFLTPSLLLSLGVDLRLFGLEPGAFYLHQLIAFSVLIVAAYYFLRDYLSMQAAAFALTLFVASAPAYAVARQLMNRHYLEGLIAALLSLWLYRRSQMSGRTSTAVLGALAYLAACSAKEVFVPLILLLPVIGSGAAATRWRRVTPFALAALVYTGWRLSLLGLGNSFTAYGALSGDGGGRELLSRLPALLGWNHAGAVALATLLLAGTALVLLRAGRVAAATTLVVGVALGAPLLPVIGRLEPRHLFLPTLAIALAVLFAIWKSTRRLSARSRGPMRSALGLLLLLASLAAMVRSPVATHLDASVERHRREGRALLTGDQDGLLLTEIDHSHHLECLTRLERQLIGRSDGPGFCGDPCYCSGAHGSLPLWRFSANGDLTEAEPSTVACSIAAPLEIDMRHDQSQRRLTWKLGPYRQGSYHALMISGSEHPGVSVPVPIPRQGSLTTSDALRFVIRYQSPDGWRTYSAVHRIDPGGRALTAEQGRSGDPGPR